MPRPVGEVFPVWTIQAALQEGRLLGMVVTMEVMQLKLPSVQAWLGALCLPQLSGVLESWEEGAAGAWIDQWENWKFHKGQEVHRSCG